MMTLGMFTMIPTTFVEINSQEYGGDMEGSFALPVMFITLREGVEAALVVGIVAAYLVKAQQVNLIKWVWIGVLGGLLISGLLGWLAETVLGGFRGALYLVTEASFALLAVALLSWMLLWMTQRSQFLKKEIQEAVQQSITNPEKAGLGIATLVGVAVLREGIEVVLFLGAQLQSGALPPLIGALVGLLLASALGYALFGLGARIDIRTFFAVLGSLLLFIVAGLLSTALGLLSSAFEWNLGPVLWDLSATLPEGTFPGVMFNALFGYTDQPHLLQFLVWLGYLLSVGTIYLRAIFPKVPVSTKPFIGNL
jgi:high-affinity iron transporter